MPASTVQHSCLVTENHPHQQLSSMADQFLAAIFGHDDAAAELAGASEEQCDGVDEGTDELEEALELELEGGAGGAGDDGGLSWEATPEEVVRRIHSVTLWFLDQLRAGSLPDIDLACRSGSSRRGGEEDEYADDDSDGGGGGGGGSGEPPARRMQQQQQTQRRTLSLVGRHPEGADALARLFLLLAAVQEQLLAGAQATQRELWYRLKTLEVTWEGWVLRWWALGAATRALIAAAECCMLYAALKPAAAAAGPQSTCPACLPGPPLPPPPLPPPPAGVPPPERCCRRHPGCSQPAAGAALSPGHHRQQQGPGGGAADHL